MFTEKQLKEIEKYMDLIVAKGQEKLKFIEITLWESEKEISLVLKQVINCELLDCEECNSFCDGVCLGCNYTVSPFTIKKYPKNNQYGISIEDISIYNARSDGRKLYYKYRKKYPLKRNLSYT